MDTNNNIGKFRNADKLTRWVKYFLYLQVVVSIIGFASGYMEYQLLSDYASGAYTSQQQAEADGIANDNRQMLVGITQLAIFIVSGILILMWIYRANYNARQLGARDMQYTPGWSVGWFFIPIAMLWKPYQAMKEIWKASHVPDSWQSASVDAILPWWWFFWLASSFLGNASFRLTLRAKELDQIMNANIVTQVSDISAIPLAFVTLTLITKIYKVQLAHRHLA